MNTLNVLTEKVLTLTQSRQQIIENREHWTRVLKPFLINQLTLIKDTFPMQWSLTYDDSAWTNLDRLSLSFDNTESGIVETKTGQPFIKQGGGLFFGQFINGKIVVMIVYPAVPNFINASPPKQIGTFDPTEIDLPFVIHVVSQFLDEMTEWEETGEHSLPRIGFRE